MSSNFDVVFATKMLDFGENLGPKRLCLFVVIRALGLLGAPLGVRFASGAFLELFWRCLGGGCAEISTIFGRSFGVIFGNLQRPRNGFAADFATNSQRIGSEMAFGPNSRNVWFAAETHCPLCAYRLLFKISVQFRAHTLAHT